MESHNSSTVSSESIDKNEYFTKNSAEMLNNERSKFEKIRNSVTGKSRAVLSVFLLSSNLAFAAEKSPHNYTPHEGYSQSTDNISVIVPDESKITQEVIDEDIEFIWGIDYVLKNISGSTFYAKRFIKTERNSGNKVILGEYDNVFEAADGLSSLPNVPDKVIKYVRYYKELVQKQNDINDRLMKQGWLQLPNGKHGVDVIGSERLLNGKTVHTEIRRTYDEKDFDLITIWEIDEDGNEISSRSVYKNSTEYDQYLELLKSLQGKS